MRIYNKTLPEIFDDLPWQYKIFVVVGVLFFIFIIVYLTHRLVFAPRLFRNLPAPLFISGYMNESIMDPSIAATKDGSSVYLAYSQIFSKNTGEAKGGIGTYIAISEAPCRDWLPAAKPFEAKSEGVIAPDGLSEMANGVWRYETPTIVHDPADKGHEWKVFAHKYFWVGNTAFAKQYGMIVMKTASDPKGEWSPEQWLLSAAPGYPPEPYQSLVQSHINLLSPALKDYIAYSRPSVIMVGDFMLMSLSAFAAGKEPAAIVLLGSQNHGRTWQYMGTPITQADAAKAGPYNRISGVSLMTDNGKVYIAAVFGDDTIQGTGTHIMRFSDLTSGKLLRDGKGNPVVLKKIPLSSQTKSATGGGFAAYSEHCKTGILASEMSAATNGFGIFKTYQTPVDSLE